MRQAVKLGDLTGRIDRLEVRCTRCSRAGRRQLAKLIAEHGADMAMPQLAVILAGDCPKVHATNPAERCFVIFPDLVKLTAPATVAPPPS